MRVLHSAGLLVWWLQKVQCWCRPQYNTRRARLEYKVQIYIDIGAPANLLSQYISDKADYIKKHTFLQNCGSYNLNPNLNYIKITLRSKVKWDYNTGPKTPPHRFKIVNKTPQKRYKEATDAVLRAMLNNFM